MLTLLIRNTQKLLFKHLLDNLSIIGFSDEILEEKNDKDYSLF